MVNKRFELYKIRREIKHSGVECKFYRPSKNDYNELEQNSCVSLSNVHFFGLYHEVNNHVELKTNTMTQWRTVKVPAFLILWEDIQSLELRTNDIAEINGEKFIITKVNNIQEWNLIADIYLEVQDIGL